MNNKTKNIKKARMKQSKLRNNRGITLIALVSIIVIILAVAFSAIYYMFFARGENAKTEEFQQGEITANTPEQIAKIENLGMDARIVTTLTEDEVPIPEGFSYVQGNKDTGIIMKSNESEIEYLFIPYDENANMELEDYYKKVDYISMDLPVLNSIKKYNGFFVELNSNFKMEDLKTINKENYEFQYEQLKYSFEDNDNTNVHMLYKEEIMQINNYLINNNIDIGENTIGIQALTIEPFSKINEEELISEAEDISINTQNLSSVNNRNIVKTSNLKLDKIATTSTTKNTTKKYVYKYKTKSKLYGGSSKSKVEIPIPSGFNYCEIDGVIMIQDASNKNLIYIWVPLDYEDFDSIRTQLWNNIYKKYRNEDGKTFSTDTELYDIIKSSKDENTTDFKNSIKKYNGFYISQAELSKNKDEEYVNISRGMVDYSVSKTTGGGDYVRGSNVKTNIYSKIKDIAEESNKNKSVKSHLMYGVEYDAALLWIAETNQDYKDKEKLDIYTVLCDNSSNVGKYSNSGLSANASASDVKSFNGIWGLGGNLSEVTQEKYNKEYVLRGGSYSDTGEHSPISSRNTATDLNKENIGFRTALYIDTDCTTTTTENDIFKYSPNDDTIEKINNVEFKLWSETPRYVNEWDGVKVYKDPNESSSVIKTLIMAEEVQVTAKAIEKITKTDGTELVWARIKLSNDQVGYINAQKLTDSITFISDGKNSIPFVKTNKLVIRYYKDDLSVYSFPNDNSLLFSTAYAGQIEIIGKSVDQKWAVYNVGQEERFVRTSQLTVNFEKETANNGVVFIKGNQKKFWTIESNVALYPEPKEENKTKLLEYGEEVTVTAISTDGIWSKIVNGNVQGYVLTNKLTLIEPSAEKKAEKGGVFTPTNDIVYVTASSLNVRTSCDSTSDANIVKAIPYRWGVDRIATGNNGWDKVNIDGKACYMVSKYLSKTQPKPIENTAKSTSTASSSTNKNTSTSSSTNKNNSTSSSTNKNTSTSSSTNKNNSTSSSTNKNNSSSSNASNNSLQFQNIPNLYVSLSWTGKGRQVCVTVRAKTEKVGRVNRIYYNRHRGGSQSLKFTTKSSGNGHIYTAYYTPASYNIEKTVYAVTSKGYKAFGMILER